MFLRYDYSHNWENTKIYYILVDSEFQKTMDTISMSDIEQENFYKLFLEEFIDIYASKDIKYCVELARFLAWLKEDKSLMFLHTIKKYHPSLYEKIEKYMVLI